MSTLQRITRYNGRNLYLLRIETIGKCDKWPDEKPYFRLIIAMEDSQISSDEEFLELAKSALDAGACSVLSSGSAAARIHHLFDMLRSDGAYDPLPGDCICTDFNPNDPLDEALWEAFHVTSGSDRFEECVPPVVVLMLESDLRIDDLLKIAGSIDQVFNDVENRN